MSADIFQKLSRIKQRKEHTNSRVGKTPTQALYTSYEELPLFLNAETLAKLLGVSMSSSYELMHEKDFPTIRVGSRLVVPKEKLQSWIDEKTGK